jgi:hypothetical protein
MLAKISAIFVNFWKEIFREEANKFSRKCQTKNHFNPD